MELVFGDCRLDLDRMELVRAAELVPLQPQVFDVLAHLVRHRDRVVTKTELLDEVWGSRFVSESALTSRVKSARQAVGDTGRDQRVIRTVHGRGYRFVAPVEPVAPIDTAAEVAIEMAIEMAGGAATTPRPAASGTEPLAALAALVAGAHHGAAITVIGPPGGGKSDLLHRLAEAAIERGLVAGRGSSSGMLTHPIQALADAVDEMANRRPELLERIPPRCRDELERVFDGGLPSTRPRLFLAVRELLVAAADPGAVLVLDNLHLADATTVAFVDEAIRITRHRRLLLVVAQDPGTAVRPGMTVHELAGPSPSSATSAASVREDRLSSEVVDALRRVALGGNRFDLPDVMAATGLDEGGAVRLVDLALGVGVAERVGTAYRFVDDDVVDRLVAALAPARAAQLRRETARRLAAAGAPPERVTAHLLAAGSVAEAAPHAVAAARRAAEADLHTDVLRWTSPIVDVVEGDLAAEVFALRADALAATGDPTAIHAYREANGGPADGAILLARGMHAYFTGDLDAAEASIVAAKPLALAPGASDRLLDVITLEGMVAHSRGAWFDRLRRELRAGRADPSLASTVFDSHLCVAEYLLYGPTPYAEVIELARSLHEQARRAGARRAEAFAAAVIGEAALLAGDLDTAREQLTSALELHLALDADTGAAHALQRLAEVELAAGDPASAELLLRRALPLARWSPLARHLLQRIYGTLVAAAPDAGAALDVVDEALGVMDEPNACPLCQVMIAVPATIACAEAGRLDDAEAHLARAEASAALWQGTAWPGAVTEARAHLERARGRDVEADRLLAEAASLYEQAGQPLDAERCVEAATETVGGSGRGVHDPPDDPPDDQLSERSLS